jgi:hypothetical protein
MCVILEETTTYGCRDCAPVHAVFSALGHGIKRTQED